MEDEEIKGLLDAIFKQTINGSRSKSAVKKAIADFKQAVSTGVKDLHSLEMTDIITAVRQESHDAAADPLRFDLLRRLLKLQVRYYRLGRDIDKEIMQMYLYLVVHHKGIYDEVCEVLQKCFKVPPFEFCVDAGVPLQKTLEKVKVFTDSLEIAVVAFSRYVYEQMAVTRKGMGPFLYFHQQIIGKEAEAENTIQYWTACLKAQSLYSTGCSKADVVRKLSESHLSHVYAFNPEFSGMSNATHKLDRYLAEAERLAAAAARGSFPY